MPVGAGQRATSRSSPCSGYPPLLSEPGRCRVGTDPEARLSSTACYAVRQTLVCEISLDTDSTVGGITIRIITPFQSRNRAPSRADGREMPTPRSAGYTSETNGRLETQHRKHRPTPVGTAPGPVETTLELHRDVAALASGAPVGRRRWRRDSELLVEMRSIPFGLEAAATDHALTTDSDGADLVVGFHAVDDGLEVLLRPVSFV